MHVGIAFWWFLHFSHSFLWISSQCEAHCSRALTSWGGSTFCLPLSHKPTHIWKWEEGNPRWWLKGSCCQGEFSPHLFYCAYVCVRACLLLMCVNVYITALNWRGSHHLYGIKKCGSNSYGKEQPLFVPAQKKWNREWCRLSIYNLHLLAAMTVKNAFWGVCMLFTL